MPDAPESMDRKPLINWLNQTRQQYINEKLMFSTQYRILSQYFFQTNKNLTPELGNAPMTQGEFLNDGEITDNAGAFAAMDMASALFSSVWKSEARTVQILPDKEIPESRDNVDYFTWATTQIVNFLERPEARFEKSLLNAVLETVIYGTTGMIVQKGDYVAPLRYSQQSVLYTLLGYNEFGDVDSAIIDKHRTAKQLVDEYGTSKLPQTVLEAYRKQDVGKRFTVSKFIGPRTQASATKGSLSFPYALHVWMPNENHYIQEGGFKTFPIPVMFLYKLEHESYGRGRGMMALPTVQKANEAMEILAVGGEATALPPLGFYDNGSLAGKYVDLSAGALSVFNVAGTLPADKPVFPLFTVGDLSVIFEWLKYLHESISKYFVLDKLYDLPTAQRMTTQEVLTRNQNQAKVQTVFNSNMMGFLTQILERSIDLLFEMGLLGVRDPDDLNDPKVIELLRQNITPRKIPSEVWKVMKAGHNWYNLQYISPAARLVRSDAYQAAVGHLQIISQLSQFIPDFQYTVNVAGTAKLLQKLQSTDLIMVNTEEEVRAIQQRVAEVRAEELKLERMKIEATANQSNAQAAAAQAGAVRTLSNMNSPQQPGA